MNLPPNIETDEVICQCFQVTESTIRKAIETAELKDIDSVTKTCEAGGGCHSCHILIQLFIDQYQEKQSANAESADSQNTGKKGILGRLFGRFKSAETST
jgi:NAD(P)H-nitrite reductase large subunit